MCFPSPFIWVCPKKPVVSVKKAAFPSLASVEFLGQTKLIFGMNYDVTLGVTSPQKVVLF